MFYFLLRGVSCVGQICLKPEPVPQPLEVCINMPGSVAAWKEIITVIELNIKWADVGSEFL